MAPVGLSIPLVGGAVGGGSVVVIAITAIFVDIVVLVLIKHLSRALLTIASYTAGIQVIVKMLLH